MLVAGPANKNTSTAPGDIPASRNPAAMGVEPVAQTYMGIPTNNISTITNQLSPHCNSQSEGTKASITAANAMPMTSHFRML